MYERRGIRAAIYALMVACLLASGAPVGQAADPTLGVVNINTATAEELELLPGIGPARARAILEARGQKGAFKSVDELVEVKGIGQTAVERLRPFATVSGKTTAQH